MKRKLKTGSIKGTPPITKFFKINPGIKGKPLTAVVAISNNISKSSVNNRCFDSANANDKLVQKFESNVEVTSNKPVAEFNKEIIETNLLNRQNLNDLALITENIINVEFETSELISSSPKRKPEKEGNTIRAKSDNFAAEQLSKFTFSAKRRILSEKEAKDKENAEAILETKIQNCCLNNTGAEDLSLSEVAYKADSTQRLEIKDKHFDISNQKQLNSNSDKAPQHLLVRSGKISNTERFSSERKDIRNLHSKSSSTDKNTVNKHTEKDPELLEKNSLNSCVVCPADTPDDLDISRKHIKNFDKELATDKKSNPSLNGTASCLETVATLNCNLSPDLFGANEEKDALISSMEESMEDGFETELSDQMFLDALDFSESKKDNTGDSAVKSDEKEISEDCLLELTENEMKIWEEMKKGDLEVEADVRDSVIDGVGKSENNDVLRSPSKEQKNDPCTSDEEDSDNEKDDEELSDEELFNPVAFLCDQRMKPDVKTPEKGVTPILGSPLTPISPFVAQPRDVAGRLKYSLDKLLLEKPKQVKREKELARLQLAMQETIEIGRNTHLADDVKTEQDDDDDDKALLPIHQKELQKYSSTDKGFSERTPGENIFPGLGEPFKHNNGCSQPFPAVDARELDEFTTFLYQKSDVEIRELLGAGWITHRYLAHPCPQYVVQWLFHILCYHVDVHTVKASYNTLWSMLNVGDSPKKGKQLSWIPTAQDVPKVFKNYGADFTLVLRTVCQSMDIGENLLKVKSEEDLSSDKNEEQDSGFFPLVNFTRLIQFITLCVARHPQSYTTEDIEHLVLLLYCISLDIRMDICQHDIKTCLQAMYGAVEPSYWLQEATKLSSVIYRIETHHRNKLRIVQMQPYTSRGRDVKRLAALQLFEALLGHNSITEVDTSIRSDFDESKDTEITNTLELFTKLKMLLREVRLNDDTDYYQLYTMIELLDIVIGAEYLRPPEKAIVEKITKKLRSLHSDIKDPRAMFISRSKVKDLILRTITKFSYMTQGQKRTEPQKSITKFFVEGKSNLHIETLKDSEILDEDEEELASQESHASSVILDPLSQTAEFSDDES